MKVVLAFSLYVACCLAATTHKPHVHHTHEPTEHETLLFHYVPKTHNMIIKQGVNNKLNCYVVTMTEQQMIDVHTDTGIRAMELKMLSNLATATVVDSSALNPVDVHACGHAPHQGTPTYYSM